MPTKAEAHIDDKPLSSPAETNGLLFNVNLAQVLYPEPGALKFLNLKTEGFSTSIPFVFKSSKIAGTRIVMPQLVPYFSLQAPASNAGDYSLQKKLYTEASNALSELNPSLVELNFLPFYWLPFHWAGFEVKPRITFRLDTRQIATDQLRKQFRENIRRQINKSEKIHEVCEAHSAETLIALNKASYRRKGDQAPIEPSVIEHFANYVQQYNCGKIIEIVENNEVIASALFGWDEQRVYYICGGMKTSDGGKNSGAMARLLWEGIQLARQREKEFDFEGSMHPGIAHFFSGFGAEMYTYYQVRKAGKMYGLYQNIKP